MPDIKYKPICYLAFRNHWYNDRFILLILGWHCNREQVKLQCNMC